MRKLVTFGSLALMLVTSGLITPQPAQAASSTIQGTLTAMSGTTAPAVLTVQSGLTTYTVNVSSSTTLVRKFFGTSTLDEFVVADLLVIKGVVTGTTIEASHIRNLTIQRRGGSFPGKVISVDAAAKTFVLDPTARRVANQTVHVSSNAKLFTGNQAGVFGDLAAGQKVMVIGLWRKTANTVEADRVMIKLTHLEGKIATVTCTSDPKTMTITTKGQNSATWTVNLTSTTVIQDKQLNAAVCTDMAVDHQVKIQGLKTGTNTIQAIKIWDRGIKRTRHAWEGTIASIDSTAKTLVLNRKKGTDPVVVTSAATVYVNRLGAAIAFTDLAVNHKVIVLGTSSGSTLNANLVIDAGLPAS